MTLSIGCFPTTAPVYKALELEDQFPDSISVLDGDQLTHPEIDEIGEQPADIIVFGRQALLASGRSITLHCNTFLSLGEIDLHSITICAERIILAGRVRIHEGAAIFNCSEVFVAIGWTFEGPERPLVISEAPSFELKPHIRLRCVTRQRKVTTILNDIVQILDVQRTVTLLREDPIDVCVREIRNQLRLRDEWNSLIFSSR